jgi:hypothetical protein
MKVWKLLRWSSRTARSRSWDDDDSTVLSDAGGPAEDADLRRDLRCDPRYPRDDARHRAAADVYDRRTIFYDLFVTASGRLLALGPPLLNLEPDLLPLRMFVHAPGLPDLGPLAPRIARPNHNCVILGTDLPPAYTGGPLSVRVVFANRLEATVTTEPPDVSDQRLVTLSTLQRDNHPKWIYDWSIYHHGRGVDRLLLYDNGSQDFASVCRVLDDLPATLDVIVVSWEYLYGLVQPSKFFCQTGSLNHAHLRFAQTSWFLNLDIDEYLVGEDADLALPAYLARQPAWTGLIELNSYGMPNIPLGCGPGVPTVREFGWRNRQPRGKYGKYALRAKAYKFSKTHTARLRFPYRRRRVPVGELAYLHYKAITTNWEHLAGLAEDRLRPEAYLADHHVQERRVIDVLSRSKMRTR